MSAPQVNFQRFREIAEEVSGRRAKPIGLIPDPANPGQNAVVASTGVGGIDPATCLIVFPLDVRFAKTIQVLLPNVKDPVGIPIPANRDFGNAADAIFWSASAVEKFVLPYYASFKDLDIVKTNIRDKFRDPAVLALIHLPDSETIGGSPAAAGVKLFAIKRDPRDAHSLVISSLF